MGNNWTKEGFGCLYVIEDHETEKHSIGDTKSIIIGRWFNRIKLYVEMEKDNLILTHIKTNMKSSAYKIEEKVGYVNKMRGDNIRYMEETLNDEDRELFIGVMKNDKVELQKLLDDTYYETITKKTTYIKLILEPNKLCKYGDYYMIWHPHIKEEEPICIGVITETEEKEEKSYSLSYALQNNIKNNINRVKYYFQ